MELIERIKKYLADQFCVEYTGQMKLTVDNSLEEYKEYTLEWPLNPDSPLPLILYGQFKDESSFFEFIKKEIKTKRFFLYKNFRAYKLPIES